MKYVSSLLAICLLLTWLLTEGSGRIAEAPQEQGPAADLVPAQLVSASPSTPAEERTSATLITPVTEPDAEAGATLGPAPEDGRWVDPRDYASAEELLSGHWKDLWPEVRAELVAAGFDPQTYPFAELRSWNELRQETADHLLGLVENKRAAYDTDRETWSDLHAAAQQIGLAERARDLDPETGRLTLAHLADIREQMDNLVANVHSGLEVLLLDSIDSEDLSTVHPIGFPRGTLGTGELQASEVAWAHVAGIEGWAYEIVLPREGYPEFTSWLDEIEELRSKRERYLRGVLGS